MKKLYWITTAFFIFACKLTIGQLAFSWAQGFGSAAQMEISYTQADALGNVYTTGNFQDTVDFDPGPGTYTMTGSEGGCYLTKSDASGNFIWAKQLGKGGVFTGPGFTIDNMGNMLLSGCFNDTIDFDPGPGTFTLSAAWPVDMYVLKLDPSGNFMFAKKAGSSSSTSETFYDIMTDALGNIYCSGEFSGVTDFDMGPATYTLSSNGLTDIVVTKMDPSGNFLWARQFGGTGMENVRFIHVDPSGNSYIPIGFENTVDFDPGPGTLTFNAGSVEDEAIVKLDPSGNLTYAKQLACSAAGTICYGLMSNPSNELFICGFLNGTTDFDPGPAVYNINVVGIDGFLLKLDPSGNFMFAQHIWNAYYHDIYLDNLSNSLFLTGQFYNSVDFDPGPATNYMTAPGSSLERDAFILQLSQSGNYVWSGQLGGSDHDLGYRIYIDGNRNVYANGLYRSAVFDADPGTGTFNLNNTANYNAFVVKLSYGTTGVQEKHPEQNVNVFPVPAFNAINLSSPDPIERITITDITGKEIMNLNPINETSVGLNIERLSQGVYFVNIQTENTNIVKKFVKE